MAMACIRRRPRAAPVRKLNSLPFRNPGLCQFSGISNPVDVINLPCALYLSPYAYPLPLRAFAPSSPYANGVTDFSPGLPGGASSDAGQPWVGVPPEIRPHRGCGTASYLALGSTCALIQPRVSHQRRNRHQHRWGRYGGPLLPLASRLTPVALRLLPSFSTAPVRKRTRYHSGIMVCANVPAFPIS